MATSNTLDLDLIPATATCTFVGEGRANIVFTLSLTNDDGNDTAHYRHSHLQGQLLRLPKATASTNNNKAIPYPELQHYWETRIRPLFPPTELVQQRLVWLPTNDLPFFVSTLNAQLAALDASGTRRPDFVGHRIADNVAIGMLVEDMRPSPSPAYRTSPIQWRMLEIKPKWLHQSPRAPTGAVQCRNCAREVWRNRQNATRKPVFCPLNLVKAADFAHDEGVAGDVAAELRRCFVGVTDAEVRNLVWWLRGTELFQRLRRIQWENDHCAARAGAAVDEEAYSLAMTLRDCSLFVLMPSCEGEDRGSFDPRQVVAKLGDTDMKNFAVKKEYWAKMEKEFHDSGVYWNTDQLAVSLTTCQLPFYRAQAGRVGGEEFGRFYLV
ncbi:unnamed protein product [Discula destructiva]